MQGLAQDTQMADLILTKYGLAAFAAILSGLGAYIVGTRLEAKKANKTLQQLSWDMDVNSRLVSIKDELKGKVQVNYAGEPVKSLTTVTFQVTNTGGATVMDQSLRFEFPEKARMLEVSLDPRPEPEQDVSEVHEKIPPGDRAFRIGHLEPGQRVQFKFVSDGGDWASWEGIHSKNTTGTVIVERRDVARVKADNEHVRPFLIQAVLLVLTQLVMSNVTFYEEVVNLVRIAFTLVLGGLLLSHLIPIVRLVERFVTSRQSTGWNNEVSGNPEGHVVQASSIMGDIYFHRSRKQDEEDDG
jgi:hypothetical protein